MLQNLTVGKKIIIGYMLVLSLLTMVGLVSYFAINKGSDGFDRYRQIARNNNLVGKIQAHMLLIRMNAKNYIISSSQKDIDGFNKQIASVRNEIDAAKNQIQNPERKAKIETIDAAFHGYEKAFQKIVRYQTERMDLVNNTLNIIGPAMEKALTGIMALAVSDGDFAATYQCSEALRNLLLGRFYTVKFLDNNSRENVERVLKEFSQTSQQLEKLNLPTGASRGQALRQEITSFLPQYEDNFRRLVTVITERNNVVANQLDRLGPEIETLTESIKTEYLAEQDHMGPMLVASNTRSLSLILIIGFGALAAGLAMAFFTTRGLTRSLKNIIDGLNDGAQQISSASSQVSSASQQLAEGASEQAASLEETSSSLEEMTGMTRQNAENAGRADDLMRKTSQVVKQTHDSMANLNASIGQISKASEETSKIIKTIDEIAFQTNLLALNAAVEAARAGEAGAGFAVVADEVRNLALRSADAAKDTTSLIENTIRLIQEGAALVKQTGTSFADVAGNVEKSTGFVSEIAAASNEQSQGIGQINMAMGKMDKVIQVNAASAEENASASEEMSAQADHLKRSVVQLAALIGGNSGKSPFPENRHRFGKNHQTRPETAAAHFILPQSKTTEKESQFRKLDDKSLLEHF